MLPELPGVGEALPAAAARVQLDARVELHVGLQLVGLPKPAVTDAALVRLLPGVDQQVAPVVLWRSKLLAALDAAMRLDAGVQQLVLLQLRRQQEAFAADDAAVGADAAVLADVVQVQVAQVEGLATGVTGEVLALAVALLVHPQSAAAAEALRAGLTAERFDGGGRAAAHVPARLGPTCPPVNYLLVLLQLAVVEEGLTTQVAHKGLLHAMNQHVGLQSPGPRKTFTTLITPGGAVGKEGDR